jgi:hypothetical protein
MVEKKIEKNIANKKNICNLAPCKHYPKAKTKKI